MTCVENAQVSQIGGGVGVECEAETGIAEGCFGRHKSALLFNKHCILLLVKCSNGTEMNLTKPNVFLCYSQRSMIGI